MYLWYGLTAALCFGLADFFATRASRRIGTLRALLAVQLAGLPVIGVAIAAAAERPATSATTWGAMIGVAAVNFAGMTLLYCAFTVGTLSLVSPIASGFAVVTAALALAAGERPPGLALAGAALLAVGVVVVSRARGEEAASLAGVPEAGGVTLCFGFSFWALGRLTPDLGSLWPVLAIRAVQGFLALVILRARPEPAPAPVRSALPFVLAAGLLDTTALIAFNLGVEGSFTTTTTALTSLYSVVTVLMAWAILRERLAHSQWAGVAVVLCGVLLVSI
jgi:drug/metabolite transporter (DMT)-like permease